MFVEHLRLVVCSERVPCAVRAKLETVTVTQVTQGEHVQFSSCHHCCCHPQSPLSPDDGTFVSDSSTSRVRLFTLTSGMYVYCMRVLTVPVHFNCSFGPPYSRRTNSVLNIKLLYSFLHSPNTILLKNRVFY